MGQIGSIHVHPNKPSLTLPGELSAVSDTVGPELVDDFEEFFDELIHYIKDPVNQLEWYFLKHLDITERSPDDFTVRVILDGKKLKKVFPAKADESDVCRLWMDILIDREKWKIQSTDWEPSKGEVKLWEMHTVFVPNEAERSFQLEIWCVTGQGERKSGKIISAICEHGFLKPLMACRFGQKVKVRSNMFSELSGGLSAFSESLDDFFTPQQFFDTIIQALKQEALDQKGEIIYKSEMEFHTSYKAELPLSEEMAKQAGQTTLCLTAGRQIVLDPPSLQIATHDYFQEELVVSRFWRVHSEPTRVEMWTVYPSGFRSGGGKDAMIIRLLLMKAISEAEIRVELEALDDNKFIF